MQGTGRQNSNKDRTASAGRWKGEKLQHNNDIKTEHYVREHQNDRGSFLFPLTSAYYVQVHQLEKLPSLSLAIIRLQRRPILVARAVPPDVSEIHGLLAYRLRLIERVVLLRRMADTNFKKAHTEKNSEYDKHVRFQSRFAARDYVLRKLPTANGVCCRPR